jgi:Uma2 family endonuclease
MMSAAVWDDPPRLENHLEPWTEDEYFALPETVWPRIELLDGALLMTPAPRTDHQRCQRNLAVLLAYAVPDDWDVIEVANVRLAPSRILIPDVVVATRADFVTMFEPSEVALVVEIVSPSSRSTDRVLKRNLYAEAGIAWYLLVELQGEHAPEVIAYRRKDGVYVEHARAHAGQELRLDEPVEVAFDPARLLSLRP